MATEMRALLGLAQRVWVPGRSVRDEHRIGGPDHRQSTRTGWAGLEQTTGRNKP